MTSTNAAATIVSGAPSLAIELSPALLADIGAAAEAAFERLPHGGLEIGGVLFGSPDQGRVTVLDWRPLAIEYASGPSFTLSANDEAALADLLALPARDPALRGLMPVGWFHSHTRSALTFTDADVALHERHFTAAWQVALLLRPAKAQPTTYTFLHRTPDGHFASGPAGQVSRPGIGERALDTDRAESKPAPIPPSGPEPPRTSRPRRGSALAWLLFLPLGAALAWLWPDNITLTQPSAEQTPPASVSVRLLLNITQDKNRVLITWDGDAALLQRATGGTLQLTDGTHHETISLNPSRLRAGSVSYQPLTPDLEVRLIVRRPGLPPHQEWTRLIVPASPGTEANAELERLRQRTEELEARLSAQANSTPPPSTPKPRETVESARAAARQVAQETLRDRQPAPVAAAPTLPDLPPWSPAPPPLREPTVSPLPNRPPAPAPAAAPYKGPRSGRLVWTGFLPAHGSVTLQPQRATSGSLTGRLPGVPIRIRAFPAELSRNGLTVYSPAATGGTFLEGPSARNGWNRTMFRWDPKRAHDVIVIEPPSSGNEWSRLVLRASDRDVSVVVVEWDVVE